MFRPSRLTIRMSILSELDLTVVTIEQALKSRRMVHFRIRTKHKIELHGNKKEFHVTYFSIRLLQGKRKGHKTTQLQKKKHS